MNGPLYWKGQLPVILLQLAAMVGLPSSCCWGA